MKLSANLKNASHLIVFLLIVIYISIFLPGAVQAIENKHDVAERQFAFAEALFLEGDYFRAITEYKRFNFFYPGHRLCMKSDFRIAESYYKAKRWQEAIDALALFISRYRQSPMLVEALFLKGMAEKELKKYNDALSSFRDIIKLESKTHTDKALYQSAVIYMDMGEWDKASKTFLLIPKDSPLYTSANIISSGLDRIENIPQKSPAAAGTLAAILPGAGHLYVERPRDALLSFLLNGAFILAAVELFRHDNYWAGGGVTFFEIGWYTGNIYSAVSSAHKYNKRAREEFLERLKESISLSLGHDSSTYANYMMFNFRF